MRSEQSLRMGMVLPCLVVTEKLKLQPSMEISSVTLVLKTQNETHLHEIQLTAKSEQVLERSI